MDLTNRIAHCAYCKVEKPSDPGLAFFEYLGEGSHDALVACGGTTTQRWGRTVPPQPCRMHEVAHGEINAGTGRPGITDHVFVPLGGQEQDRYYCGCRGWD